VLYGDSAFAANMMDNAIADLATFKRRYEPYVDLWIRFGDLFQGVMNQISEFEDVAKVEGATAQTDKALAKLMAWREEYAAILALWTGAREHVQFILEAIGDAEKTFGRINQ